MLVKPHSLADLTNTDDRAWLVAQQLISEARNPTVVHKRDPVRSARALEELQFFTDSTIGALVYQTGGLSVDDGWLRFVAGGSNEIPYDLAHPWAPKDELLVVAYDAVGGFFAQNRGRFLGKKGTVWYLAPDTLEWEEIAEGYLDLLFWALTNDITGFYSNVRWPGWRREVKTLPGDRAYSFYPPLWSKEGQDVSKSSRRAIPIAELWDLHTSQMNGRGDT